MKKLMMLFAVGAAILMTGCTSTSVKFEKDDKGLVKYEITRNDHWLKTDASGLQGSMTKDGDFSVAADGLASSPSEEFNKTMKTYSAAIVSMMQIAAAAYNPSASAATQSVTTQSADAKQGTGTSITVNTAQTEPQAAAKETVQPIATTNAVDCATCTDGSCEVK